MKSKKINIFLGGFINLTNAQNLNCLALARHLDKDKFNCFALELYSGQLPSQKGKIDGLRIFRCLKPARISLYFGFLWGIWKCDVAYLPKHELWKFNRFLLRLFNKKSFTTIEGIFDQDNLDSAIDVLGSYESVIASKNFFTTLYPITHFLGQYNYEHHKINVDSKTLYLGCDTASFMNDTKKSGVLKNVIYIGRLKKRKGIYDFLKIAEQFPKLQFYIFGDGEEKTAIETFLLKNKLTHIKLMGIANHEILAAYLKETDLHILPSRSEGFPKVTLETSAAGVPSLVYSDYGAYEWITHNHNGFVVDTLDQMIETVKQLNENSELLQSNSRNAIEMAKQFDWKVLIKDWEMEILKLVDNE
jgi:glycosyltransferase involved in cell wall biosynthesis